MSEDFAASLAAYRAYSRRPYSERRVSDFIAIVDSLFPVAGYTANDHILDQALIANLRLFRESLNLFLLYDRPPTSTWESMASSTVTAPSVIKQESTQASKKRSRSDRDRTQDFQQEVAISLPGSEPKFLGERSLLQKTKHSQPTFATHIRNPHPPDSVVITAKLNGAGTSL